MIAQRFCQRARVRERKHSPAYGVASMCAHAGKSAPQTAPSAPTVARPHCARARAAQSVPGTTFEKAKYLIEGK